MAAMWPVIKQIAQSAAATLTWMRGGSSTDNQHPDPVLQTDLNDGSQDTQHVQQSGSTSAVAAAVSQDAPEHMPKIDIPRSISTDLSVSSNAGSTEAAAEDDFASCACFINDLLKQ